MTPNVRYRPGQKIQPAPPPPPAPSPNEGKAPGPVLKITDDSPLVKLLQSSGRTPTHPLTAKAAPALKKVTPVDVQKSEQAFRQAKIHAERGRLEETFKSLEKAYLLNPDSEKAALALSEILTVGGNPEFAHNLLGEFLGRHPESLPIRHGRLSLSRMLLAQLINEVGGWEVLTPEDVTRRKEGIEKIAAALNIDIDQALIFRAQAPALREQLKEFESKSTEIHAMDFEAKAEILDQLQSASDQLQALAASPRLADAEGQMIAAELKTLGKEISDKLLRFAESDSNPQIHSQVPLSKANQAIAEGRLDDALAYFETYRDAGCKELGNGDSEKGISILREKFQSAEAHFKNNNEAEAEKAVEGISRNLLLAHKFIEEAGAAKLRQANLAALAAWREEIIAEAQSQRENVGALDNAWDKIWRPEVTEADKILKSETIRLNLVSAVRARLESGKFK
ncbi:MAG TPA: hypothetical protein VJR29_12670, partial [bacterium]|nr:hypothetical protein [bacterium]